MQITFSQTYQKVLIVSILLLLSFIAKAQHPMYEKFGIVALKSMDGEINKVDSLSFPPYFVYSYNYSNDKIYGAGILISEKNSKKDSLIWNHMVGGDFPPHTLTWLDFNGDGRKDLFLLTGFEDVFVSTLFINNIKDNQDPNDNFKVLYNNKNCYATLIDIDKDSKPELIEGGADGEFLSYEITKSVRSAIDKEYDRIVGGFDKYNITYNMPEVYKQFNLFLLSEFKILKIKDNKMVDVTSSCKQHLHCRRNMLLKVKSSDERTKEKIESLVDYVDKYIGDEE